MDRKTTDDSILKIHKNDNEICENSETYNFDSLDNTLDIVNYILSNGPANNVSSKSNYKALSEQKSGLECDLKKCALSPKKHCLRDNDNDKQSSYVTLVKINCDDYQYNVLNNAVPQSIDTSEQVVFKAPYTPISTKKQIDKSQKKTFSKNNTYQHIASPIAKYIRNTPVTPLVKDIHPRKPLPELFFKSNDSNSPKLRKWNKENVALPSVAYKTAKKTLLVVVPDEKKLPQSPQIKKLTSELAEPLIIKHDSRHVNLVEKPLRMVQEHSYADLPFSQADVSVCTTKSAFHKPN
ncbi:hypothetical protein ACJJTC_008745 [Scirpophaga incertulas]